MRLPPASEVASSDAPSNVVRVAACSCGQLRAVCIGEPVRISVCHCLACQRRSGSAFAAQARWPDDRIEVRGEFRERTRVGDAGARGVFRFCPTCGSTVTYVINAMPGVTAVALGAFADPAFPRPRFSVYENRKHAWTAVLGDDVERWNSSLKGETSCPASRPRKSV
jgi:hypothetical protein